MQHKFPLSNTLLEMYLIHLFNIVLDKTASNIDKYTYCLQSYLAIGANVSLKSAPSNCVHPYATRYALFLITIPFLLVLF